MKDKEHSQKIFILGVIIFLIIALVIVFVIRYTVFKTGKYLTTLPESELIKQGYGTYKTAFSTGCLTASGKCTVSGVKYTTQYCVPNTDTGKGCLTQKGELTFASQTITENCLPNCRSNVLNDVSQTSEYSDYSSLCNYPAPYNQSDYPCVPRNIRADQYSIFNCTPNDPVGENSCNYVCGSDGISANGISGDTDPSLPSYIPNCVGKKGNIITLNSFNWDLVGNIPNQGFYITKGYKITNHLEEDGTVSVNRFTVDPPYLPPASKTNPIPISKTVITKKELSELDNQFIVLENCNPIAPKPICQNRYVYTPIEVGGNITANDQKVAPFTPINTFLTKSCYVSPYWSVSPTGPTGAISNYTDPYAVIPVGDGFTGTYSMLPGIGGFGVTYEYQACLPTNYTPTPIGTDTQTYNMPPAYSVNSQCVPLTISNTGPGNNLCYTDNNFVPFPLAADTNYNICDTIFPDKSRPPGYNGTNVPGTIAQCQYLPENEVIDFTGETTDSIVLVSELKNLIGSYIQISTSDTITNTQYFLGLTTTPCATGTDSDILQPLSNCNTVSPITGSPVDEYNSQRCMFIYYGDVGGAETAAGAFWDRLNCDSEMIGLVNSINMIVSPRNINSSTSITCDLFGYFGTVFGQFYAEPSITSSGDYELYFQPMTQSERTNPLYYRTQTFDINYNTGTSQIEITVTGSSSGSSILVDSYNGITLTTNFFEISGVTGNFPISPKTVSFYGPVIKTGGINAGANVRNTMFQQRNNECYYSACDPAVFLENNPCFPKTCNLYNEYNLELC